MFELHLNAVRILMLQDRREEANEYKKQFYQVPAPMVGSGSYDIEITPRLRCQSVHPVQVDVYEVDLGTLRERKGTRLP